MISSEFTNFEILATFIGIHNTSIFTIICCVVVIVTSKRNSFAFGASDFTLNWKLLLYHKSHDDKLFLLCHIFHTRGLILIALIAAFVTSYFGTLFAKTWVTNFIYSKIENWFLLKFMEPRLDNYTLWSIGYGTYDKVNIK